MRNKISDGNTVTITSPALTKSGDGVLVGSLFGVAGKDAAAGASVTLHMTGEYTLPKGAATVFSLGDQVAWDAGACVAAGASVKTIGVATEAAGASLTIVKVRIGSVAW